MIAPARCEGRGEHGRPRRLSSQRGAVPRCWRQLAPPTSPPRSSPLCCDAVGGPLVPPASGVARAGRCGGSGHSPLLLTPVGWRGIVFGGLLLDCPMEQSALVLSCTRAGEPADAVVTALRFAYGTCYAVLRVGRMVRPTLMAVAPFAGCAGLSTYALLGDRDINFYLKEPAPAFLAAVSIGVIAQWRWPSCCCACSRAGSMRCAGALRDVPPARALASSRGARAAIALRSSRDRGMGRWRWRRSRLRPPRSRSGSRERSCRGPRIRCAALAGDSAPRCLSGRGESRHQPAGTTSFATVLFTLYWESAGAGTRTHRGSRGRALLAVGRPSS